MRKSLTNIGFGAILFCSWILPMYSLTYNRLNPSYESALGVAYGFLIGCFVHLLLLGLWLIIRRAKIYRWELIVLTTSFVILIIFTVISNNGSLSKVSS